MPEADTSRDGSGDLEVLVFQDAGSLAAHGAEWIAGVLVELTFDGTAVLAVSGGRSPWAMFSMLAARRDVQWSRVHIVQVDERIAPAGSDERNWTAAARVFGPVIPSENLHPMPVESDDLSAAAASYDGLLRELTSGRGPDIVHLGLGADGHTASLFPEDEAAGACTQGVVVTARPHAGRRRMTMTFPSIASARQIVWHVQGEDKAGMFARLVQGDESIPAGRVPRRNARAFADAAAASLLP